MSYRLDETTYNSQNFTPENLVPQVFLRPRTIDSLTIHWWGAFNQSHSGVSGYLSRPMGNTSAHETISAGLVDVLIAHANAAWHSGNPIGNATSVGLELRPEGTKGDYDTAAERIYDIRKMHGKDLPLIPHRNWQATACPGNYNLAELDRISRAFTAPNVPLPPSKPSQEVPPGRYWIVDPGDTLSVIAGFYGIGIDQILMLNPQITNPNVISVGQFIDIPEEGGYDSVRGWIVDPGDSLGYIAAYYGVSVESIVRLNGLANANLIYPGQYLRIPNS